ncbi:hypothetical protein AMJ44_07150 [candidate division WOR-1 bacterium DG_54_3]|uniref:POTRA domain-containing protein n=1 Tax=candidate division WOR-1 bacterium DG_54_3 TaxID=1703775 RepID=A0A0S7XZT0_UNCSA|nr:MAG: hypothetical protein AMJ44_07150 [candidate division WOR-1 bacterium DG_54_3]
MKRISALCIFCFLLISNSVMQVFAQDRESVDSKIIQQEVNEEERNKEPQKIDKSSLQWTIGKDIQTLEEAEKYLEKLLKQRNILVGDFFGINQTAYRYALVFDRLGYIRYRIFQIDKEIKMTKQKITELKRKSKKRMN